MYRIVKKPRGYIVEVKTYKWTLFGLKIVWKPFIKTSGMYCAWHHSSYDFAMMNLLSEVKKQTKNYIGFEVNINNIKEGDILGVRNDGSYGNVKNKI